MDKKIAGLKIAGFLGAAAALTTMTAVQANAAPAADQAVPASARNYAELLDPVPNADAQLKADDAAQAKVELAQYVYIYRRHHHHHHHHHHRRVYRVFPPFIFGYAPRRHHHHHHHHHHHYRRYY